MVDPSLFTAPYDRELARALAARGASVELVGRPLRLGERSFDGAPFAFTALFYPFTEGPGARLPGPVRIPAKALEHLVGMAGLRRRMGARRPDVIHLQWLPWPGHDARVLRRLRRLAPVVVTVHDSEPFQGAATSRLQGGHDGIREADAVIVHTEDASRKLLAEGVDRDRLLVLPHPPLPLPEGLSPTPFRPPVRTLVLLGELKPYKGLDVLVEALGRLGPGSPLRLVVAGRPRMDVAPICRRASQLVLGDRIEWRPRRLDERALAEVLGAADAFVLPYRHADASGVLSLVLALGRPLVASRVGAMAEVLEDGVSALLVPPGDDDALAQALGRLVDDTTAVRLAVGTADAHRRLGTWDAAAAGHLDLYRRLIADRTSRTMRP